LAAFKLVERLIYRRRVPLPAQLIRTGSAMDIVGVAGGVSRVYLGLDLWRSRRNEMKGGSKIERVPYWAESSRLPPILTSFYGGLPSGLLVLKPLNFGLIGVVLFASVHLSCDLGWELFLSRSAFEAENILGNKVRKGTFMISSVIMVSFGGWFILSGLGAIW